MHSGHNMSVQSDPVGSPLRIEVRVWADRDPRLFALLTAMKPRRRAGALLSLALEGALPSALARTPLAGEESQQSGDARPRPTAASKRTAANARGFIVEQSVSSQVDNDIDIAVGRLTW